MENYKRVLKYESDCKDQDYKMYYLFEQRVISLENEIGGLIHRIYQKVKAEQEGRGMYHFNVHEFLKIQSVNSSLKYEILRLLTVTLSIYPIDMQNLYKPLIKELIESFKTGDQLTGMKRKDVFGDTFMNNLLTELVKGGMLKQKDKTGFLKAFNPDAVFDCDPVQWTGSNPELATMIKELTGKDPIPSLVNKYFDPKFNYSSNSKGERTNNQKIKKIIKNL